MKLFIIIITSFIALTLPSITIADTLTTKAIKPVYFMAQLKIVDKDRFYSEYVPEVKKHIKAGKGEVLFGGESPALQLEGTWDYFTIVIEFPSKENFDSFYYSEGNLNIAIPIRQEVTSVNNTMLFN